MRQLPVITATSSCLGVPFCYQLEKNQFTPSLSEHVASYFSARPTSQQSSFTSIGSIGVSVQKAPRGPTTFRRFPEAVLVHRRVHWLRRRAKMTTFASNAPAEERLLVAVGFAVWEWGYLRKFRGKLTASLFSWKRVL